MIISLFDSASIHFISNSLLPNFLSHENCSQLVKARRGLSNQLPLALFALLISNRSHSIFHWITFYRSLVIFLSAVYNDLFSHYLTNLPIFSYSAPTQRSLPPNCETPRLKFTRGTLVYLLWLFLLSKLPRFGLPARCWRIFLRGLKKSILQRRLSFFWPIHPASDSEFSPLIQISFYCS